MPQRIFKSVTADKIKGYEIVLSKMGVGLMKAEALVGGHPLASGGGVVDIDGLEDL